MPTETSPQETLEQESAKTKKKINDFLYLFFSPIQAYLSDDDVSEILINGHKQVFIEKKGKLALTDARFVSEEALRAAAGNVARSIGRALNEKCPILDARLPDGSRVCAIISPVSRDGTTMSIRKFRKDSLCIADLIKYGSIDKVGAKLIETIVKMRRNVMVSGATSSGKTSVLNILSSFIDQKDRILVIEDSSELQLQQQHVVGFETRKPDRNGEGEVSIRDLVRASLRLRPDRLVVGEIRGGEAIDLLQALNTGHSGSMTTIHSNSAEDSLLRLETCALMSGIGIPLEALRAQIASAIHIVIQTARLADGGRKITGITEVLGLENGKYICSDLYTFKQEGLDKDGAILGHHTGCGNVPRFFEAAKQMRLSIEQEWFESV